jgi:CheY-like chemotaxis protein
MWTFGLIMIVTYLSYFSPEWAQGWRLRRSQPVVSSAPQASAAEHWWAQYRHVTFTAWPFAQLDRIQVERPRVLLVEREDSARTDLQFDLHKAGFACHAVPDVPQACQFLDQYPADALLLVARPSTEVSELLEFRRFLLRMGAAAPVSVTLLPAGHGTEVQATEDHALFRGQPLFEELRRRLLLVLRERAVTDDEALTLTRRAQAQPSPATLVKNS